MGHTVYDEESDGFTFKRAKAAPKVAPIQEESREEEAKPMPVKRSRKESPDLPSNDSVENDAKVEKPRRRSSRHSGENNAASPPPLNPKKRRVKEKQLEEPKPRRNDESTTTHDREESHGRINSVGNSHRDEQVERTHEITKVSLPFADTPVIRRNQEMRKGSGDGQRRSSLGMRGRRASSLIDSGKSNGRKVFRRGVEYC